MVRKGLTRPLSRCPPGRNQEKRRWLAAVRRIGALFPPGGGSAISGEFATTASRSLAPLLRGEGGVRGSIESSAWITLRTSSILPITWAAHEMPLTWIAPASASAAEAIRPLPKGEGVLTLALTIAAIMQVTVAHNVIARSIGRAKAGQQSSSWPGLSRPSTSSLF